MQTQTRRQLSAKLKVGGEAAAQVVLQNLLDRIPAERQLHQLRQHLETSQGFLEWTIGPDQAQAVDNVAFRTEAAHGGQDFCILNRCSGDEGASALVLHLTGFLGSTRAWKGHQPQRERFTGRQVDGGSNRLADGQTAPRTGDIQLLPSRQSSIHRSLIRGTALGALQSIFELFKGRSVGLWRVLFKSFQQLEQFLGPELLITPLSKRGFAGIELAP